MTDNDSFFNYLKLIESKLQEVNWSEQDFKKYVSEQYGKSSKFALADNELQEIYQYLSGLPQKSKFDLTNLSIDISKLKRL